VVRQQPPMAKISNINRLPLELFGRRRCCVIGPLSGSNLKADKQQTLASKVIKRYTKATPLAVRPEGPQKKVFKTLKFKYGVLILFISFHLYKNKSG
jgi:hypothetical protein